MLAAAVVVAFFASSVADLPPGAVMRLGDPRFLAAGEVRHLQFSPDGTLLSAWVRGPGGGLQHVAWDAATGFPRRIPPDRSPPDAPVGTTPAVRLAGDRVLTAGPGNAGRIWDASPARQFAQLTGHTGPVTAVAASADGRWLATGSTDGFVRVWDAGTFRPLVEPRGHTATIRSIRVAANGLRAITGGDDGTARVWDLATGKELAAFRASGPLELTSDGLCVLVRENGLTVPRDVVTGLEVVLRDPPQPPALALSELLTAWGVVLAISPDGRAIAVIRPNGTIVLFEAATGEPRRSISGPGRGCTAVEFTPDGTRLLTAGADRTVLVWDVRVQSVPLPATVRNETRAAKHWAALTTGPADAAYLAMARLAAEPPAAVKMARLRLMPATGRETNTASRLADTRAIELLESVGTPEAREFLKELAEGHPAAWRTQDAKRALERLKK